MLFLAVFTVFILGLILTVFLHVDRNSLVKVLTSPYIRQSLWISVWTSCTAAAISLLFAVPAGYALSRYRFPGRFLVDAILDLPIVFPPFVVGLIFLIFFKDSAAGRYIQETLGLEFILKPKGIVLCQFFVAATFAVRFAKVAFDAVDTRCEQVALTLGCTRWGSFRHVTLPQAANGIVAGGILTWARSFGLFGPLLVFAGSIRGSTETLSSTIYIEQSSGNFEAAFAAALLSVFIAFIAILTIRLVSRKAVAF